MMFRNHYISLSQLGEAGFSIVELLVAIIILPIMVFTTVNAYNTIRHEYSVTRQLNEMYAVLSACPELDRALDFTALASTTNCYPNNTFAAEDGGAATITYSPSLTLTDTSNLASTDPLHSIPDSKVVSVSVSYPKPNDALPPLQLRMLITRNGIGQQ
jgi:hypothetical protein